MATLRDIKRRIRSVRNTQQITRAMKMIAASKLRKTQDRLMAMRPYAESLGRTVRWFLEEATPDEHPLLEEREAKTVGAVLLTADRGLCGAFNGSLVREAQSFLRRNHDRSPKLIAIGKKGVDLFRRRSVELLEAHTHIAEDVTLRSAGDMAQRLVAYYRDGSVDEVHLIHASFVSTLKHPIVQHRLLPFDREALPAPDPSEKEGASRVVIYEPSHDGVCEPIFTRFLAARIYAAFLESLSSEFASRMTAMDAATQNADDMIARLTMDYNRARQWAITREILDIVGGAEALK